MTMRQFNLVKPGTVKKNLQDIPVKGRIGVCEWDTALERLINLAKKQEGTSGVKIAWTPDAGVMIKAQLGVDDIAAWLNRRLGLGGFTRLNGYAISATF
tara:strand:- start:5348 stop:5644 length:297 start_codon:yes stop_codon:yes gene_type:complete